MPLALNIHIIPTRWLLHSRRVPKNTAQSDIAGNRARRATTREFTEMHRSRQGRRNRVELSQLCKKSMQAKPTHAVTGPSELDVAGSHCDVAPETQAEPSGSFEPISIHAHHHPSLGT